jgi:hypothetical protein
MDRGRPKNTNKLENPKLIQYILVIGLMLRLILVPFHVDYGTTTTIDASVGYDYCNIRDTLPFDFGFYQCFT